MKPQTKMPVAQSDAVVEVLALVMTLRDAVCNSEINPNSEHYWVLIDEIAERLRVLAGE